jgi:hypothetical protein
LFAHGVDPDLAVQPDALARVLGLRDCSAYMLTLLCEVSEASSKRADLFVQRAPFVSQSAELV